MNGTVDLRTALGAELDRAYQQNQDHGLTIATTNRTYHLKAESAASAEEWVKQLQKAIFEAQNGGDSVKISLPIDNILDVENNPLLDFTDTLKIRIVDNDETFAVDEVSKPNSGLRDHFRLLTNAGSTSFPSSTLDKMH